jgi:cyclopropane fatty-acyl-phospholipid synthase-like methyltransferase
VAQPDQYFLGYREAEQARLQRQAQELAHEAQALFDRIGLGAGARVVEIGCGPQGCLDLLAERVGPTGRVVGVERSEDAVRLARRLVAERGLMELKGALGRHIEDPETLVVSHLFIQAWGRRPG